VDYRFDESREAAFYQAIRRYYPGLRDGTLQPGYTGIRPKIHGSGQPAPDFLIQGEAAHGVPGLVNLYGIESPGLTSSLAIADHVTAMLGAR
jgi:L-2-hydroxyglutarate oxidase LhgO